MFIIEIRNLKGELLFTYADSDVPLVGDLIEARDDLDTSSPSYKVESRKKVFWKLPRDPGPASAASPTWILYCKAPLGA